MHAEHLVLEAAHARVAAARAALAANENAKTRGEFLIASTLLEEKQKAIEAERDKSAKAEAAHARAELARVTTMVSRPAVYEAIAPELTEARVLAVKMARVLDAIDAKRAAIQREADAVAPLARRLGAQMPDVTAVALPYATHGEVGRATKAAMLEAGFDPRRVLEALAG